MADNFGLNAIGLNIDASKWITTGALAGLAIVGLLIVGIILLVWWYITKHDKKVYLFFKTGDGIVIKENKGEKNIKKREFKLLYNRRINCVYPESKHTFLKNGKECYAGYVINDICTWMEISADKLTAPDANLMNFQAEQFLRIDEATKGIPSFWDKYGKDLLWITTIVVFAFVIFLILKSVDKAIQMGMSVTQACQQVGVKAFINSTQIL